MPRGILQSSQPEVRLVSPTQSAPPFFGFGFVQSLSLCRNGSKLLSDGILQELQADQVLQFPSIGFGLSPQFGQGHTQTLRCTKTDKITNNCTSCRTHMAIVILQQNSNEVHSTDLDDLHRCKNKLELKSLRNDKR